MSRREKRKGGYERFIQLVSIMLLCLLFGSVPDAFYSWEVFKVIIPFMTISMGYLQSPSSKSH